MVFGRIMQGPGTLVLTNHTNFKTLNTMLENLLKCLYVVLIRPGKY